jgi:hypothetical protein
MISRLRYILCVVLAGIAGMHSVYAQQTEGERQDAEEYEVKRVEAVIEDMVQQSEDLNLPHADPHQIMEYCQATLPKLDDIFRIQMLYAPANLKLAFRIIMLCFANSFSTILSWHK